MNNKRTWGRVLVPVLVLVGAGGGWVVTHTADLRAMYAARRLAAATTDEERARWADALVGYGDPGVRKLTDCIQSGSDPTRDAATSALERHLDAMPDGDPRAVTVSGVVLDPFPTADEPARRATLRLVPFIMKRAGTVHAARCREVVAAGLKMPDLPTRLLAARLAAHPDLRLRGELMPLLSAPEPELRAAALFVVTSAAEGDLVMSDEELFRWLHDPDPGVRKVCRDALVSRDRSDAEITLGRRFTSPDPVERLKLLLDLLYDDDVADPEPWLERLSRDPEPAVRAGAARVAVEMALARRQPSPAWVGRVADTDPHPTVRLIAGYYRARPSAAVPVRPAGGPE